MLVNAHCAATTFAAVVAIAWCCFALQFCWLCQFSYVCECARVVAARHSGTGTGTRCPTATRTPKPLSPLRAPFFSHIISLSLSQRGRNRSLAELVERALFHTCSLAKFSLSHYLESTVECVRQRALRCIFYAHTPSNTHFQLSVCAQLSVFILCYCCCIL